MVIYMNDAGKEIINMEKEFAKQLMEIYMKEALMMTRSIY